MPRSDDNKYGVDKGFLYGVYQRGADWRDRLHKKLAHKALDIYDEDEMNVDNSRRVQGLGWRELLVLLLAGGGFYWLWLNQTHQTHQPSPMPSAPAAAAAAPVDSEYEVRFYDAEGNPISIPHISQRGK